MTTIDARDLAAHLTDRSTQGLARDTARLVRIGVLPVGARLPSLRDLAFVMEISPSTLSEAWKELRRLRVLTGRGRNGTYVSASNLSPRPLRVSAQGHFSPSTRNLTLAVPDLSLLPQLDQALLHGARAEKLNSYERVRILPELEQVLRPDWPFRSAAMLATNGGYNAVYLSLHALVQPGSAVALEMPASMRILDILEDLGARILPVESDGFGPKPDALKAVLEQKPDAFVFQPVISSVTGLHCTAQRLSELGDVLSESETLIIEDDGIGEIAMAPSQSLGDRLPDRVIHIRSFSKSFGPDLRMAVLSASEDLVGRVQSFRAFSAGWTSRILQSAVAWLQADEETRAGIQSAGATYRERRNALARALRERGIDVPDGAGLSLYLPVHSETFALITLAAHGISALAGESFSLAPTGHIRLGTGRLDLGEIPALADIAKLAAATPFEHRADP
ncbi:PLP-dependent aminotransferase family protein [Pararhodobacter oceanensis]|uniref:aminotransferase-like domain-containing protein n=1 Tax=Pararhodobacter oceanensis TaxID=2172121 RepID=UPI003A90F8C9